MQKTNKKTIANIEAIIAESTRRQKEQQKEFYLFGKLFYINEPFVEDVNVQVVIDTIEKVIPRHLFQEVDNVMVGSFDFLEERALEAMYKDGAIYVTNQLYTEKDLLENIIHEASHSVEEVLGYHIYSDQKIYNEFVGKRERLESILKSAGYDVGGLNFAETEYDKEFDRFLLEEVGYANLGNLIMGLFVSPYAATCLREYWGVGFEDYFIGDRKYLRKVSPELFKKIEGVITYED